MAITFINSAVPTANPTTSFTVTIPTVAVDDILVLSATNRDADTAPSVTDNDSGGNTWARLESGTGCLTVWWKRATSATSAKTITASGFTGSSSGVLCVYRGCRLGTPYEAVSYENNISGNESHAAITSTRALAWIVLCIGNDSNDLAVTVSPTATSPSTITLRAEKLSTGGSDCSNTQCAAEQSAAGTTGTVNWAQVDGASCSVVLALVPAASVTAVSGSYADTGNATGLLWNHQTAADAGTYSITGNAAGLTVGGGADPVIVADAGTYAVTGNAATLTRNVPLTAVAGSYAVSGNAVGLRWDHKVVAVAGAYAITGNAATLTKTRLVAATSGSYAVTGNAAGLRWDHRVAAVAGTYVVTGNAVTLTKTRLVSATSGTYAVSGNAVGLRWARRMISVVGAYNATGNGAGLSRGISLPATAGTHAVNGNAAGLRWDHKIVGAVGDYLLIGSNVVLDDGALAPAETGVFAGTLTPHGMPGGKVVPIPNPISDLHHST